jgi:hypothetical protein
MPPPPLPPEGVVLPAELFRRRAYRSRLHETALRRVPPDQDARRVYADWVDLEGDPEYAAALRWLADRGKCPHLDNAAHLRDGQFPAYLMGRGYDPLGRSQDLPDPLFEAVAAALPAPAGDSWDPFLHTAEVVTHKNPSWIGFRSVRLCQEYLAVGLARLAARGVAV